MGQRIKAVVLDSNRAELIEMIRRAPAGAEFAIEYGTPHTMEQRAKMRSLLRDIAAQVPWQGTKVPEEHWKNIFTAILKKETIYEAVNTVLVLSGESTRDMLAEEMSGMIDLMQSFGDEAGVKFKGDSVAQAREQSLEF